MDDDNRRRIAWQAYLDQAEAAVAEADLKSKEAFFKLRESERKSKRHHDAGQGYYLADTLAREKLWQWRMCLAGGFGSAVVWGARGATSADALLIGLMVAFFIAAPLLRRKRHIYQEEVKARLASVEFPADLRPEQDEKAYAAYQAKVAADREELARAFPNIEDRLAHLSEKEAEAEEEITKARLAREQADARSQVAGRWSLIILAILWTSVGFLIAAAISLIGVGLAIFGLTSFSSSTIGFFGFTGLAWCGMAVASKLTDKYFRRPAAKTEAGEV